MAAHCKEAQRADEWKVGGTVGLLLSKVYFFSVSSPSNTDGDEDQADQAGGGSGIGLRLGWSLPVLLLAYCLGIGPAARLHRSTPAARPAIEAFYKPLTILIDHCRPIRGFFEWYVAAVWKVK